MTSTDRAGRIARSALAGVLLVNAVPHGVAALQGRRFPSPFATPPGRGLSTPLVNAGWSAANLVAGLAALPRRRSRRAAIVGAGAMGVFLAAYFGSLDLD
ncbi:hypothetical protein EDF36_0697 [Rathayibacter sp. PhB152]|uniref:hypothetical protein n=1 Tax=unclassified Rathayibacter TaxID=2609250 RepID=UPI000FAD0577|nr:MULTISPECIES: hypothetical protein [unclassified Rathayibacter]ROQ65194.1 hypothetical protein EDF36_0697 [Rathayibacter sp. PhB152]ROS28375.1 hypothetical protein EDF22_0097 [Rathayibacter sp. PhB127]